MSYKTSSDKMEATRAFINLWLKDRTKFCVQCGKLFDIKNPICCHDPYIVDNMKRIKDFISANREQKQLMANSYGSTKQQNLRFSIRMPEELMRALQKYFAQYGEDFLVDKKEGRKFMKEFPQFCACERI